MGLCTLVEVLNSINIIDSCEILYPTGGGTSDYTRKLGVKYSFSLELRDTGNFGFLLPSTFIIPTAEETLQGLVAVWRVMAERENLARIEGKSESQRNEATIMVISVLILMLFL